MALRFLLGRTQREIAEEVGLSQVQVSRLIRSSLAELRTAYDDAALVEGDGDG